MREINIETLIPQCGIREAGGSVGWVSMDFTSLLAYLRKGLCLDEYFIKEILEGNYDHLHELISSIPSPFARLWFYYMVLEDEGDNMLKGAIIEEMRDIWTILAFKDELKLDIRYKPLEMGTDQSSNSSFISLLRQYNVDAQYFLNRRLEIILFNNKPIAMLSPLTLIVPAPEYRKIVPIKTLRRILDKDSLWKCSLIRYLEGIIEHLRNKVSSNENNIPKIIIEDLGNKSKPLDILLRYLKDEVGSLRNNLHTDEKQYEKYIENVEILNPGNFPRMSIKIKRPMYDKNFVVQSGRDSEKIIIVIPKETLFKEFVRVYNVINSYLYRDLVHNNRENDKDNENTEKNPILKSIYDNLMNGKYGIEFFTTDDIIEDRIITYTLDSKSSQKEYYFHPIKERFLKKIIEMGVYNLFMNGLKIERSKDGFYNITLTLPNLYSSDIIIHKRIQSIRMKDVPPLILIYPYNTGREQIWYVGLIRHDQTDSDLSVILDEDKHVQHVQTLIHEARITHIYKYKKKPYFFKVKYGRYFNTLLVPAKGDKIFQLDRMERLAMIVDIGTSNTTFIVTGTDSVSGEVKRLYPVDLIEQHLVVLPNTDILSLNIRLGNPTQALLNDIAALLFIPYMKGGKRYVPTMFFRGYHNSYSDIKNILFDDGKPIIVSDTMFSQKDRYEVLKKLMEISDTDIKWVSHEEDKRPSIYIRTLFSLFLSTLEIPPNEPLSIYYAYPNRLNVNEKYLEEYFTPVYRGIKIRGFREAEALFSYFYTRYGKAVDNSITLDMGGGSTEVVFWGDNDIRYMDTILIGGDLILAESLRTILCATDPNYWENCSREDRKLIDHLNAVIFTRHGVLDNSIMNIIMEDFLKGNRTHRRYLETLTGAKLYALLFVVVWGYSYIIEDVSDKNIFVFIAGNMSKVVDEIYGTKLKDIAEERILPSLKLQGSNPSLNIEYSLDPKLEVVLGIEEFYKNSIPKYYGEKIMKGKGKKKHASPDSNDILVDLTKDDFERFLKELIGSLNEHLGDHFGREYSLSKEFLLTLNKIRSALEEYKDSIVARIRSEIGFSIYPFTKTMERVLRIIYRDMDKIFKDVYEK